MQLRASILITANRNDRSKFFLIKLNGQRMFERFAVSELSPVTARSHWRVAEVCEHIKGHSRMSLRILMFAVDYCILISQKVKVNACLSLVH